MRRTNGDILSQLKTTLEKTAFIPNPQIMAQQQQQDPSQGGQPPDPSQGQGQPPQDPSQQGGQPQDPSQGQVQDPQALAQALGNPGDPSQAQDAQSGQSSAPTDLRNVTINVTVADLLDLVSGGKATMSKLKVDQLVHKHQQKMQQDQAKQQQAEEQQAQEQAMQSAQQQGGAMGQGGIYGAPMDGSQPGQPAPQPQMGMGQ